MAGLSERKVKIKCHVQAVLWQQHFLSCSAAAQPRQEAAAETGPKYIRTLDRLETQRASFVRHRSHFHFLLQLYDAGKDAAKDAASACVPLEDLSCS